MYPNKMWKLILRKNIDDMTCQFKIFEHWKLYNPYIEHCKELWTKSVAK